MNIKDYFENQIKKLADHLNIDFNAYVNKWKEIDKKENIGSSSVVLYQLGKDKSFIKDIKEKSHSLAGTLSNAFIDYITDENKWSYLGFCPYKPTLRMKHLLDFPLNLVLDMIADPKYKEEQNEKIESLGIQNMEVPDAPSSIVVRGGKEDIPDNEQIIGLLEELICRLDSIKPLLQAWEKYYIYFSKIYSELAKRFQDTF